MAPIKMNGKALDFNSKEKSVSSLLLKSEVFSQFMIKMGEIEVPKRYRRNLFLLTKNQSYRMAKKVKAEHTNSPFIRQIDRMIAAGRGDDHLPGACALGPGSLGLTANKFRACPEYSLTLHRLIMQEIVAGRGMSPAQKELLRATESKTAVKSYEVFESYLRTVRVEEKSFFLRLEGCTGKVFLNPEISLESRVNGITDYGDPNLTLFETKDIE